MRHRPRGHESSGHRKEPPDPIRYTAAELEQRLQILRNPANRAWIAEENVQLYRQMLERTERACRRHLAGVPWWLASLLEMERRPGRALHGAAEPSPHEAEDGDDDEDDIFL
ncbi:MAG: hypothetical protein GX774_11365 [Armatimonadetes bacterium]|jgi:hypothetical protein|nr:hypothetical protein [Armatimonadota bacterium]